MKKNRKKAASTAPISRGSMGARRVRKRLNTELVVVFIAGEYTGPRDAWNRLSRRRTSTASRYFSRAGATLREVMASRRGSHDVQVVVVTRGTGGGAHGLRQLAAAASGTEAAAQRECV